MTIPQKITGATVVSFSFIFLLCIAFPGAAFTATYIQDSFTRADGSGGSASASASVAAATPVSAPSPSPSTFVASANCNLSAPAFCETFNQGPSAIRGRGGDLDPSKWATARLSGEISSSGQGTANPVPVAPIPTCRAGITQTSVFPANDTLICDPNGMQSSQLMTAVSMQNYGVNSYMARQPFDFSGRTGKIDFDVDAVDQGLGGFIELELTEDPSPATTFRELQNFEVGPTPRNGLTLRFSQFAECPNAVAPVNTFVYNNYVGTIVAPTFNHRNGCAKVSRGSLNHFEVQVSQSHIDVYGSDFSTDNGQTFPHYKLLYSANMNLPFARGYVHFNPRNHATIKYGFGPDVVFHWDNIGFDGPVISAPRAYEIPDNTTVTTYNGSQGQNLGYQLLDGTTGKPAGIYSPSTKIDALTFQNVNTSGITSATLTLNAFFNMATHTPDKTWGFGYRLNGGGTWKDRKLTTGDLAGIYAIAGGPLGILSLTVDVPITDLVSGANTLELLPLNAPMDYPPVVANIDLLLGTSGSVSPSPTSTPTPTPKPKFTIGARVQATANVDVRGTANTAGTLLATDTTGLLGTVTGGSTAQDGFNWWQVTYDNGISGWSTEDFLTSYAAPTPTPSPTPPTAPTSSPIAGNCGMQRGGAPAFCDTFDAPAGIGNRSGQLNGTVWGVSRGTGDMNFGADWAAPWVKATLDGCNGPQPAQPDGTDVIICNGQLREATNDNATGAYEAGGVIELAMYPKQPFDFAGRTGTVSFDVSNDTQGTHGAWPEFWLTDKPIPTPFTHFDNSGGNIPVNGLGIRFAAAVTPGQGAQLGSNCPNDKSGRWTVDSAIAIRNSVIDDTAGYGSRSNMTVTPTGCVTKSSGPNGGLNHVELSISQNRIEVWATDAGTVAPLKQIAVISNANLSLTRGLIWLEDVHYNADKSLQLPLQHNHTFTWDNVAFDGPATYRDLSYDVNDSLTPCHDGTLCLGWDANDASQPVRVNTMPMNIGDINAAASQRLMFNAYFFAQPSSFSFTINGHPYNAAWPYPYTQSYATGSFSFDINKADLVAGPQAIEIWADRAVVVSNINIVLVDVGPAGTTPTPTPYAPGQPPR